MSAILDVEQQSILTRTFGCLTERPRRRLLAELEDRQGTASERTLAAALAEGESAASDPAADVFEEFRVALRHVHLPKLDAVDLVTWNESAGTVSLTDHPFNESDRFRSLLGAEDARWDALATAYADRRRLAVLAALDSASGSLSRGALADAVAARVDADTSPDGTESIARQLHHQHLPNLADAGLIEYDAAEGTATAGDRDVPRVAPPYPDDRMTETEQ